MRAIYKRELRSYFHSMIGYIFIAFLVAYTGIYFLAYNLNYGYPYFSYVLSGILFGSTVVVTKIEGDSAYKRRIMDMGITKGSELYIRKVAPLGDPVEITVRGYELSVRKDDAQCVQVK